MKVQAVLDGMMKVSFIGDVYNDDGQTSVASGVLQIGSQKFKGEFTYSERAGLSWKFGDKGDKAMTDLSDNDGTADDFAEWTYKIIDGIQQGAQVESLLGLVEAIRRDEARRQIMTLFQYMHKFPEKERAQEMSDWLKSKDFSEEDFQILAKEYDKQLSDLGDTAKKYPELLGTDGEE